MHPFVIFVSGSARRCSGLLVGWMDGWLHKWLRFVVLGRTSEKRVFREALRFWHWILGRVGGDRDQRNFSGEFGASRSLHWAQSELREASSISGKVYLLRIHPPCGYWRSSPHINLGVFFCNELITLHGCLPEWQMVVLVGMEFSLFFSR